MNASQLQPERRFDRAQDAQRGVMVRLRGFVPAEDMDMTADQLEDLGLQLQLASVNLMTAARELRECEEERRKLALWREQQDRRYPWEREDHA